jgi:four helix bundle protein
MLPFERFEAWKACHALALAVYQLTAAFPTRELYGLTSQMRRAAFSAAANIAEGSAKRGPGELRRYLEISLGSLSELAYALLLARDLNLIDDAQWNRVDALRDAAGKLTWGLYRSLKTDISPVAR